MDRVEKQIVVDAPIERVWSVLTTASYLAQWYAFDGAELDLRPGGAMVLRWKEHGTFHGRVVTVDPPHAFSFRYALLAADTPPDDTNSTLVEFTLAARDNQTWIRVVESGFDKLAAPPAEQLSHAASSDQAWGVGLNGLKDIAQSGE